VTLLKRGYITNRTFVSYKKVLSLLRTNSIVGFKILQNTLVFSKRDTFTKRVYFVQLLQPLHYRHIDPNFGQINKPVRVLSHVQIRNHNFTPELDICIILSNNKTSKSWYIRDIWWKHRCKSQDRQLLANRINNTVECIQPTVKHCQH